MASTANTRNMTLNTRDRSQNSKGHHGILGRGPQNIKDKTQKYKGSVAELRTGYRILEQGHIIFRIGPQSMKDRN